MTRRRGPTSMVPFLQDRFLRGGPSVQKEFDGSRAAAWAASSKKQQRNKLVAEASTERQ